MMTDTECPGGAAPHPRVFVEGDPTVVHSDAGAVICGADTAIDATGERRHVIWRFSQGMPPPGARVCAVDGLEAAATLVADAPELIVIPRAEVRRAAPRYGFSPGNGGSGFSTYQIDPATVSAFEVCEDSQSAPLGDWLRQAASLGFDEVWLHGIEAEEARRGFPCDLLAKAHRIAPELQFWISGGGCQPAHFKTIARMPGLAALVVKDETLSEFGPGEITEALRAPEAAEGRGRA